MKQNNSALVERITRLFEQRGDNMYAGEPVTQTEHALQCAMQAEQVGASAAMIAAALLHDVGHLLHDFDEDCAEQGIDDRHEQLGAEWLQEHFGPDVSEPVRLHVPAKRYRCSVDQAYHDRLSDASKLSLRLQGGPMVADEASKFREHPFFGDAIQLRTWDEAAKATNLETPTLAHFLTYVEQSLR